MAEEIDRYYYERTAAEHGFMCVCGIDEAGRGPLAGPVFAAAVILPGDYVIEGLNDSKKLSEKKRDMLFDEIKEHAVYAVASASVEEIDEIANSRRLIPIIAHVHRYMGVYSKSDLESLMSVDAVFQINAEAFEHFSTRRFVNKLISSGRDFVFGSDAHDLDDRKPNFDLIAKRSGSENIRRSDKVLMSAMADEERMFAF